MTLPNTSNYQNRSLQKLRRLIHFYLPKFHKATHSQCSVAQRNPKCKPLKISLRTQSCHHLKFSLCLLNKLIRLLLLNLSLQSQQTSLLNSSSNRQPSVQLTPSLRHKRTLSTSHNRYRPSKRIHLLLCSKLNSTSKHNKTSTHSHKLKTNLGKTTIHSLMPNKVTSNRQCLMLLRECNSSRQTQLVPKRNYSQVVRLVLILARRRMLVNVLIIFLIWVAESGRLKASASTDKPHLLIKF